MRFLSKIQALQTSIVASKFKVGEIYSTDVLNDDDYDALSVYIKYAGGGISMEDITLDYDEMSETDDIKHWLKSKTTHEGVAKDLELIEDIGKNGITDPVVIDPDAEYTIEGRHRLTAALKFGLTVPVFMVTRKED